jgi:hypothetical protein
MEQAIDIKFPCVSCGKTFRWKPEIAGKKGKCSCGASITVPANSPGAAKTPAKVSVPISVVPKKVVTVTKAVGSGAAVTVPLPRKPVVAVASPPTPAKPKPVAPLPMPPPPPEPVLAQETDQETYDVAGDDISQLGSLLPSAEAVPVIEVETAEPLEYQRPQRASKKGRVEQIDESTGELYDPMRDYIVPAIMLAAGLGGIAAMFLISGGMGPLAELAISIAFVLMLAYTLVKTLVLIVAAVPIAAYCDVYVGLLRKAVLKFGAMILFGDVVAGWLMRGLQSTGAISPRGDGGFAGWIAYWLILTGIYYASCIYLFRLSPGDFKFAWMMSIVSRAFNFFLEIALVALAMSILSHRAQPAASPYIAANQQPLIIAPGTPVTAQPGQNTPTVLDDTISQQLKQNPFGFMEGYAWCRTGAADDAGKKLVGDMYGAGADKVYVRGFTLYASLPGDLAKRAACLDVAHAFRAKYGLPDTPALNNLNYQYVVIDMLGERFNNLHH